MARAGQQRDASAEPVRGPLLIAKVRGVATDVYPRKIFCFRAGIRFPHYRDMQTELGQPGGPRPGRWPARSQ